MGNDKWDISPEFEVLRKIPVITSSRQIKMVQLLFGGLMKKEKGDDRLSVKQLKLPCAASPKGRLRTVSYAPKGRENEVLPTVLLLHGGAFVFPAFPYHYRIARHTAIHSQCRVFMPDYDLAPNHKSPIQHEEAYLIYRHLLDNADKYLIDIKRLVLLGDSAGGTLCAALCARLRKEGLPLPKGQLLLYPSLDARLNSPSMKLYTDVPVCNSKAVIAYYKMCAPEQGETPREFCSPAEAPDLAGTPPTYVETAEFDCLHDDGILYAERLKDAGCEVVLNETKGTVHGYDMVKESSILKASYERRTKFINERFSEN